MSETLELIRALSACTEAQLQAAIALDGPRLAQLNQQRTDLTFQLQVALQDPPQGEERTLLAGEARTLADLEVRLASIASNVVSALDRVVPHAPPVTYGRTGMVFRPSP